LYFDAILASFLLMVLQFWIKIAEKCKTHGVLNREKVCVPHADALFGRWIF